MRDDWCVPFAAFCSIMQPGLIGRIPPLVESKKPLLPFGKRGFTYKHHQLPLQNLSAQSCHQVVHILYLHKGH